MLTMLQRFYILKHLEVCTFFLLYYQIELLNEDSDTSIHKIQFVLFQVVLQESFYQHV